MPDQRNLRNPGEIIILGGISYQLEDIEGYGYSSIVYKASYRDELDPKAFHHVFIKELYPLTEDESIYRMKNGNIGFTADGKSKMEFYRKQFFVSNRINLELLSQIPSGAPGNINSYEAYGTFYSVLSLHGGNNLMKLLVKDHKKYSLRESIVITQKLLTALDIFHKNKLLHLDISPDNILLLPDQALLIDYNSVWDIQNNSQDEFFISEKRGYSAPEVRKRQFHSIHYCTDLYSVCAVFFHLIMRRPLQAKEIYGNGLHQCFSSKLEVFQDMKKTVNSKTVAILLKGLHRLPELRYQSVSELAFDLEELLNLIDSKGISLSILWENSRTAYFHTPQAKEKYIRQSIKLQSGEIITAEEVMRQLENGHQLLLTGAAGMGKTRLLMELWKQNVTAYFPQSAVLIYVPLKDYQNFVGKHSFIRDMILREILFADEQANYQDSLHELELLFSKKRKNHVNIILLLDGLNEAGPRREPLLREIEKLGEKAGIGILLTERTTQVQEYGLKTFDSSELQPLTADTVKQALIQANCRFPESQALEDALCNPMMLGLYKRVLTLSEDNQEKPEEIQGIHDINDLVKLYLDELLISQLRIDAGDEVMQLNHRYILQHLYPSIAAAMTKKKKTVLTYDELMTVVQQSYKMLTDSAFNRQFREYTGKSRLMLCSMNKLQWFDFTISEQLISNMGLLVKSSGGNYSLTHDNYQQYLTTVAKNNQILFYQSPKSIAALIFQILVVIFTLSGAMNFTDQISEMESDLNSTRYYLAAAMVYDIPVGIGEISKAEIKNVYAYYEIKTINGEVSEYTYYVKAGNDIGLIAYAHDIELEHYGYFPSYFGYANGHELKTKATVRLGTQGITANVNYDALITLGDNNYRIVTATDEIETSTSYTLSEMSLCHGGYYTVPDEAIRLMETYTEEGYIQSELFLDGDITAKNICTNEDGIAGVEFEYNEAGLISAQYYLDRNRTRIPINEIYKILYSYNKNGQVTEISFQNRDGFYVNGNDGWARSERHYNENHNISQETLYDIDGSSIYSISYEFIEGLPTRILIYNADGRLSNRPNGFAEVRITYRDDLLVSLEYFDVQGNPCNGPLGYSKWIINTTTSLQENTSDIKSVYFYSADGNLCINSMYNVAGVIYDYTDDGKICKLTFIDAKEHPCNGNMGFAVIECAKQNDEGYFGEVYWYDESGNIISILEDPAYENAIIGIGLDNNVASIY